MSFADEIKNARSGEKIDTIKKEYVKAVEQIIEDYQNEIIKNLKKELLVRVSNGETGKLSGMVSVPNSKYYELPVELRLKIYGAMQDGYNEIIIPELLEKGIDPYICQWTNMQKIYLSVWRQDLSQKRRFLRTTWEYKISITEFGKYILKKLQEKLALDNIKINTLQCAINGKIVPIEGYTLEEVGVKDDAPLEISYEIET